MVDFGAAPRFIVSDIDGTFLGENARVAPRTRAVVERATSQGTHFALATGRPHRWLLEVVEQLSQKPLCVLSNGAVIYDSAHDHIVHAHELTPEAMSHVYSIATEVFTPLGGINIACERAGQSAYDPVDSLFISDHRYSDLIGKEGFGIAAPDEVIARPAVKMLLLNPELKAADMYAALAPHIDSTRVHMTYSMDKGLLEFTAPGVTKATGVRYLAQQYGVAQHEIIAFGDMPNDIEMLSWVGHGVAMGNARPEVKEVAQEIAPPHTDDGVAQVLERWF
ncbi:HAD family hydrolase [Corynebacterium sp. sy039]|uniref:HAD family hydrolase n=1 Tax=Corynebacterium sp. sy039 TaxID=2599641 RepID=UPI0011B390DE|nr:HAD family hydrolase [Corynebacterium sp. sy039]QDZ43361.1 HAD family hydrolase [Corynebacterium sp. sy039]